VSARGPFSAAAYRALHDACDVKALRAALAAGSVLPVRAYAASELSSIGDKGAAPSLEDACDALADQAELLATNAGGRCARTFSEALASLLVASLPDLPAKGSPSGAQLKAVAKAAREKPVAAPAK
jgi:hypothetical protein